MSRQSYRQDFFCCYHDWRMEGDINDVSGPGKGNGILICKKCEVCVTIVEKCTLDQTLLQKDSLHIQERHTKIGMIANIISALALIVTCITLIVGSQK